jgi:hypothetical protein
LGSIPWSGRSFFLVAEAAGGGALVVADDSEVGGRLGCGVLAVDLTGLTGQAALIRLKAVLPDERVRTSPVAATTRPRP